MMDYIVLDLKMEDCKVISNIMLMWVILSSSGEFRELVKNTHNELLVYAYNESLRSMKDGSFISLNKKMIDTYKAASSEGL